MTKDLIRQEVKEFELKRIARIFVIVRNGKKSERIFKKNGELTLNAKYHLGKIQLNGTNPSLYFKTQFEMMPNLEFFPLRLFWGKQANQRFSLWTPPLKNLYEDLKDETDEETAFYLSAKNLTIDEILAILKNNPDKNRLKFLKGAYPEKFEEIKNLVQKN